MARVRANSNVDTWKPREGGFGPAFAQEAPIGRNAHPHPNPPRRPLDSAAVAESGVFFWLKRAQLACAFLAFLSMGCDPASTQSPSQASEPSVAESVPPAPAPALMPPAPALALKKAPSAVPTPKPIQKAPPAASKAEQGPSAAFSGTFSGEGLELELRAEGGSEGLRGTLRVNRQTVSVQGEAVAKGEARGNAEVGGKRHPWSANLLAEDQLAFRTEGRVYRLRRRVPGKTASARPGASKKGVWSGRYRGAQATLALKLLDETRIAGTLKSQGLSYALSARCEAPRRARGSLRDPLEGRSSNVFLSREAERLVLTWEVRTGERTAFRTLVFKPE